MKKQNLCRHYFISGKVQGVWFRSNAEKKALQLGLTGWIKNLKDGRVEAVACGDEVNLEKFERWLWKGPMMAKVKDVQAVDIPNQNFVTFEAR